MTAVLILAVALASSAPEEVNWAYSYELARKQAGDSKLIMVYLRNNRSETGAAHARDVLADPMILARLKNVVPLSVFGYDDVGQFFMKRFVVTSYPSFLFVDGKGNEFGRIPTLYRGGACAFEMDRAVRLFQGYSTAVQTLKTKPDDPGSHALLAEVYAARSAEKLAESHLAKAVGAPGEAHANALVYVGDMYQNGRKEDMAVPNFRKAIGLTSDPALLSYIYMSLGHCLAASDPEESTQFFTKAAELKDGYPAWVEDAKGMLSRIQPRQPSLTQS